MQRLKRLLTLQDISTWQESKGRSALHVQNKIYLKLLSNQFYCRKYKQYKAIVAYQQNGHPATRDSSRESQLARRLHTLH